MSAKTKTWLYKEISKRGLFTLNDVKDMIHIMQEVLEEQIYLQGEELKSSTSKDRHIEVFRMSGLFNLYLKEIAEHDGWNAVKNERLRVPISYKIVMTPSRTLLKLIKGGAYEEEEVDDEGEEA
jgi:hypothetical protein